MALELSLRAVSNREYGNKVQSGNNRPGRELEDREHWNKECKGKNVAGTMSTLGKFRNREHVTKLKLGNNSKGTEPKAGPWQGTRVWEKKLYS